MKHLTKMAILALTSGLLPCANSFATLTLAMDTNTISIPFAPTDYNSSTGAPKVIKTLAQTLTIKFTTSTWMLSVRALTSTFLFTPRLLDANPNKPSADLGVRAPSTIA